MAVCSQSQSKVVSIVLFSFFVLLTACAGGGGAQKADTPPALGNAPAASNPPVASEPLLAQKYDNIIVFEFETTPEVKQEYPDAARECQANAITALQMLNTYKSVAPQKPGAAYTNNALLVKAKIKEMRLVSTSARIWGGAFAGSSYMNVDVRLIDAGSNKEVRKKELNSATNAFAAAWTSGSSDRSLPADMGKIIAEYIQSVVPQK